MTLADIFLHTLQVTLPVFAMVFVGIGLKRMGWIDTAFISTASALVFKGTLPTLIFLSIIQADLGSTLDPWLLAFFAVATLATFALSWLWAIWRIPRSDCGVFVQGAFRGNCGIIGLALAANMYGDIGLSIGGLLLIVVVITYNPATVLVLTAYNSDRRTDWRHIFGAIVRNPLVVAALLAVVFALSGLSLPTWVLTTGDYFASLTLPLALICTGGTLSIGALLHAERSVTLSAALMKMIVLPALATAAAWGVGFTGAQLGVLFLYFSSPTSASSFVMAKMMGGNDRLAANIIALTTLLASITVTGGVFALRAVGLI